MEKWYDRRKIVRWRRRKVRRVRVVRGGKEMEMVEMY